MAAISTFLENELVDHILRNAAYTGPVTVYAALHTADNGLEAGTITGEVAVGSYARESVAFDAPTDGATANTADVTFTTASADWGTVTHVSIMDAATVGNVLFHGALTASKTVQNGDTFKFTAGDLDISIA